MTTEAISAAALASLLEQVARRIHSQGYAADLFPAQWAAIRAMGWGRADIRRAHLAELAVAVLPGIVLGAALSVGIAVLASTG